jgi:hypothetical protein
MNFTKGGRTNNSDRRRDVLRKKKLQDITKNLIVMSQMILIKKNNVNQILCVCVTTRGQKARMFKEELQETEFSPII